MSFQTGIYFYLSCLLLQGIILQAQAQQGIVISSSGEQCFGQTVTLTCSHPDPFQDLVKYRLESIAWAENGVRLDLSLPATDERFTTTRLNTTASTLSFAVTEEDHANRVINCSCFLVLNGGGREESDPPITIDVNETIHPPTLVSTPNSTSGLLQWNSPSSSCSNYQYIFTLNWTRIEDSSMYTVSTEENRHILTGGNYTATVTAKIVGLNLNKSEPLSVPFFMTPMAEPSTATELPGSDYIAYLAILPVAILLLLPIPIVVVIYCVRRNRKKRVSHSHSADATELVQPPLEFPYVPDLQALGQPPLKKEEAAENEYGEAPSKKEEAEAEDELGQTRQKLDKKQEAENDQVQYAAIDFSGQRPIAPPSLETVVYTETVEQFRKARKNRPIPPLPPVKTEEEEEEEKQLAQEAAEITADFKAQVVAILQASKLVYRTLDPEEPVVGTYQKKTFVANFVHAPGGKEILSSEVEAIIKARELQSTDKGFLVATTDSISGPWLEYLEKHNCHFIGLSRKGGVKKEMLLKKLSFCFPESSSF